MVFFLPSFYLYRIEPYLSYEISFSCVIILLFSIVYWLFSLLRFYLYRMDPNLSYARSFLCALILFFHLNCYFYFSSQFTCIPLILFFHLNCYFYFSSQLTCIPLIFFFHLIGYFFISSSRFTCNALVIFLLRPLLFTQVIFDSCVVVMYKYRVSNSIH